jgi:hypothetical protein
MRVESKITSVSWIPMESVSGLGKQFFQLGVSHYDPPPPDRLESIDALRASDRFRFANVLEAWADFDDATPVAHGHRGGLVMGSSTAQFGPVSLRVKGLELPTLSPEPEVGDGWLRFRQTVGGRTGFPLPRRLSTVPFLRLQAPVVWTTLELTLFADTSAHGEMSGASPFPRHWVFDAEDALTAKSGIADWGQWLAQPSWRQTPWGDQDTVALVTDAESSLERQISSAIMDGRHPPVIRRVPVGEIVMAEGRPGATVALILDGLFAVMTHDEEIAEIGPGVVIGEGAALESGLRSATVVAKTPGRLAEIRADELDPDSLRDLADQHYRANHPD